MQLLLCASTEFEIKPTIDFIRSENIQNIEILITGVGVMATTFALTKKIANSRPDFILQAGVAGCLDEHLPLTKIVLVEMKILAIWGLKKMEISKHCLI